MHETICLYFSIVSRYFRLLLIVFVDVLIAGLHGNSFDRWFCRHHAGYCRRAMIWPWCRGFRGQVGSKTHKTWSIVSRGGIQLVNCRRLCLLASAARRLATVLLGHWFWCLLCGQFRCEYSLPSHVAAHSALSLMDGRNRMSSSP